jgi:hypothetical protein
VHAAAAATALEASSVGGGGSWGVGAEALRAIKQAQAQACALARFVMAPPVAPRGCLEAAGRARKAARSAADAGLAFCAQL